MVSERAQRSDVDRLNDSLGRQLPAETPTGLIGANADRRSLSVDFRTRTEADVRDVDPADFCFRELPERLAAHGHLAAPGAAELGVDSFTICSSAGPITLALVDGEFVTTRDDTGAAAVVLDDEQLAGIANDLRTPMTLLTGGQLDMPRGNLGDFLDWWVVLRSVLDEIPAHTRGAVEFRDAHGEPLDLDRAFGPDDTNADIAAFLLEAGFVHLRGWFPTELMDRISADMDASFGDYVNGDGNSWWVTTASGEERCVRMQRFHQKSAATAELLASPAFRRLAALTGEGHEPRGEDANRIEALEKPIGVVEGISDVPWHKDCSLGMHSYNCCFLTMGISVTGAGERSGQLRVVPGSHRALVQPAFVRSEWGLPIRDLPTETGDVTIHLSCTLHMAQPPVDRERRVLYTALFLPNPEAGDALSKGLAEIGRVREGAYKTVSQTPGHLG